jgi:hypothetical protein
MKINNYLRWALFGWLAGIGALVIIAYLIMPAVIGSRPQQNPGSLTLFGFALLLISPAALVGGIVGGKLQYEGGTSSTWAMAALAGACATIPFACLGLWYSGW